MKKCVFASLDHAIDIWRACNSEEGGNEENENGDGVVEERDCRWKRIHARRTAHHSTSRLGVEDVR